VRSSSPASATPGASPLAQRRQQLLPFTVIGLLCVIAGGLLATATIPDGYGRSPRASAALKAAQR
jgi:hypothetical protein